MLESVCVAVDINVHIISRKNPFAIMSAPYPPDAGYNVVPGFVPPGPPVGFPVPSMPPNFDQQQQTQATLPSAPPAPVGYEGTQYDNRMLIAPPTYFPQEDVRETISAEAFQIPVLNEEQVRNALMHHVSDKSCWGSGAARDLKIVKIEMSSSYHYHIETFTEKRESSWTFTTLSDSSHSMGQMTGNMPMGQPPGPWDIAVQPEKLFKETEQKIEVPFTSNIRPCHSGCFNGRARCPTCEGIGNNNCTSCDGKGLRTQADESTAKCDSCNGTGRTKCTVCGGDGRVKCKTCNGTGSLRYFIELIVKFEVHDDDVVTDSAGLKKKYVTKVDGKIAVKDEGFRVVPFYNFPDQKIAEASKDLVEKHASKWPMERILKQKHFVKVVPIATVHWEYKNDNGIFYVYGDESDRRVYFNDYPMRICYCCSIA